MSENRQIFVWETIERRTEEWGCSDRPIEDITLETQGS